MNKSYPRYTVTSALPYANGPLHIGHIGGVYVPADTYVRYIRSQERDIVFICGSDEHGAAITLRAKKEGISPRDIIDKYHKIIKESFERLGISFDIYHRTSEEIHHETSKEFFRYLYDKGEFVEKVSEQYYDEEYDQFLADRYIKGTCPNCGNPEAYGDQCEKCGSSLSPLDLKNPLSTLSGKSPVLRSTKHWYLPLDKYQPWLESWLETKKSTWKRNVHGQCTSWLKLGLQPRSMTRDLDWGIDVPLPDAEGKKLYVWLDAPIGYVSATKQWALDNGKDWKPYWLKQENEEDNSRLLHFIGKDNIVFHCITFPSILNAMDTYLVPDNVPANEFLNLEGDKISTSRNWAVWLHEYLDDFPGRTDELRYVLLSIAPETKDSEFTWKDFQSRINNELVKILGNYVNRVIVLTNKYFEAVVPDVDISSDEAALEALKTVNGHIQAVEDKLENFKFREALAEFINIARLGNGYLTEQEPWKKWKTDQEAVKRSLYTNLQIIAKIGVVAKVFLPETANKIFSLLELDGTNLNWKSLVQDHLVGIGHQIFKGKKAELLFTPIEDEAIEAQIEKLQGTKAAPSLFPPQKEEISFDDFQKMDIRIGTILEAAKVPKADRLLQFKVDTGVDTRTIVSGVAKFFEPEQLIGKQVPVLMNLAPRKIRGVVSQGMILFAEDSEETLHLLDPEKDIDAGSMVN